MLDEERDALLRKIDTSITELVKTDIRIKTILFDSNGNKGLCSRFETICNEVATNKAQVVRLWVAVSIIATSVGGGTFGVIKLLAGG